MERQADLVLPQGFGKIRGRVLHIGVQHISLDVRHLIGQNLAVLPGKGLPLPARTIHGRLQFLIAVSVIVELIFFRSGALPVRCPQPLCQLL